MSKSTVAKSGEIPTYVRGYCSGYCICRLHCNIHDQSKGHHGTVDKSGMLHGVNLLSEKLFVSWNNQETIYWFSGAHASASCGVMNMMCCAML